MENDRELMKRIRESNDRHEQKIKELELERRLRELERKMGCRRV